MFVHLVFNLHLNRCCSWSLTERAITCSCTGLMEVTTGSWLWCLFYTTEFHLLTLKGYWQDIWLTDSYPEHIISSSFFCYMKRTDSASLLLTSTLYCSGLQRLILTGLKLACSPFHFDFTSITPNRGCQQRLNYVMLDLGGPEMLSRQLTKCTLEGFVINNFILLL